MAFTRSAALIILSATGTSSFVQVGPQAPRGPPPLELARNSRVTPLHATEEFQRSLLEARLGVNKASKEAEESLVEAKEAYDAINKAMAATPAQPDANAKPIGAASIPAAEVSAPEPEPVVAKPFIPEPEPVAAKPFIPEPEPVVAKAEKVIKPTEFTVPREFAIVPVNESTVQFTAGALGGAAGLLLGGPILGAVSAAAFNYVSRKDDSPSSDNSAKKVVDTASQTAILGWNFLASFEKENKLFDGFLKLLEKAVDGAKASDSSAGEAILTLESTLGGIANKVQDLDDEYDLVQGAGTVLDSVGDLIEMSVDKVVDLNEEYKLTERVSEVVKGAVDKASK